MKRKFLPKQLAYLRSTAPNVLYSGAVRAGKTYALCTGAMMRATVPHAREAIIRKHRVTLTATTLVTLLEGDGMNPPVLPPNSYTHNKNEGVIRLNGGGEIVYFGLDDPNKIGSRSLTGANIDEAVEVTERDWDMIQTRVSLDVPGLVRQVRGACNPGSPGHFLARRFGLAHGHVAMPGHVSFRTRSRENFFLPADYLERISHLQGAAYRRLVEGEWVGSEGLVFDNWDREVHVVENPGPFAWSVIGVDDGSTNPFAALLIDVDGDGRAHVCREVYGSKMLIQAKAAAVRELMQAGQVERVIVDPAAAQLRHELHELDIATEGGDNAVLDGLQVVAQRLAPAVDGRPRLTVDPSCTNLIREFESYEWLVTPGGLSKDAPKKENDHALDALRLACMALRFDAMQVF